MRRPPGPMLFNSLVFLAFLPIALGGALSLRGNAWRVWVLIASYVFYGYWDPRFLVLIAGSTVVDYVCASRIHTSDVAAVRTRWLLVSLAAGQTPRNRGTAPGTAMACT